MIQSEVQFLETLDYQDSDAMIKVNNLSNYLSSLSTEVLLEVLTEEFKIVVMEK